MSPEVAAIAHVGAAALGPMIDPARTAVVVIDVQQDFAAPTGALGRIGVDLSGVEPAIDRIEAILAAARRVGAAVAFVRVMSSPDSDSKALKLLNARKGNGPDAIAICREDQPGAGYYRLRPAPGDLEVSKRLFNAFHGTRLDEELRARGIDTLVVVGFATDCCVDATCRDAFHRDYSVFVVSDATGAYAADLHAGTLKALQKNCALVTGSAAVVAAWA